MSDSHVVLYRASDPVEANLLAHALENAGIPVGLVGGNVPDETAESTLTELWVPRKDLDRGRQVIEEYQHKSLDR
jgi:hypothetical protein